MRILFAEKNILKICVRFYGSDKPTKVLKETEKLYKKQELLHESANIVTDSSEECAKFEERVIKQVLVEKEQDATLQSRLSKDCKILFSGSSSKSSLTKCGSIRLDPITFQKDSLDWVSYNFDNLQTEGSNNNLQRPVNTKIENIATIGENVGVSHASSAGGGNTQNTMRPVRTEPGKVILTFIPEEWWRAFISKTGVTGFGVFLFSFGTFLVSKEYYVLEHYYYHGLSSFILWAYGIKYVGPLVAKWLDKEVDTYEKSWNEGREQQKQALEDSILHELHLQFQTSGEQMLIDVKRENVLLQLEEEYRKRQMHAYNEVKRRLDYHVAVELVRQRVQHRNLIEYVTGEVVKSITPEMQDKLIYYSIDQIIQDLGDEKNKK